MRSSTYYYRKAWDAAELGRWLSRDEYIAKARRAAEIERKRRVIKAKSRR